MKLSNIALALSLISGIAVAQDEHDFGSLVFGGHFRILNSGTHANNLSALGGLNKKSGTGKNDDIEYFTGNTPKRSMSRKWEDQRLIVERKDDKIIRISQLAYELDPNSEKHVVTFSLNDEGKVTSRTYCDQSFSSGMFGTLHRKGSTRCRTINPQVCDYVEKNALEKAFEEDMRKCGEVIEKIIHHQGELAKLSDKDAAANTKILKDVDKLVSDAVDLYKYPTITLKDASSVALGFDELTEDCKELKKNDMLASLPDHGDPKEKKSKKKAKQK